MSREESKAVIARYLAEMRDDKSKLDAYIADEALKQRINEFEAAFPGYGITIEDVIAEGDKVVVRGVVHGRHGGDYMGIPPTGKEVKMPMVVIYRIEDDKIVEHWIVADRLGLLQQLDVMPPMGEGA